MDNKEQCRKLANRIYELDEKVYKTSGSGLGKTFTGEKARVLDDLTMLIVSNPQGHLLRSELALIGNMARSIRIHTDFQAFLGYATFWLNIMIFWKK